MLIYFCFEGWIHELSSAGSGVLYFVQRLMDGLKAKSHKQYIIDLQKSRNVSYHEISQMDSALLLCDCGM